MGPSVGALSKTRGHAPARRPAESGFSLIEVVISMALLTVGMVSMLGVFGLAMATTQGTQQDMIAKQLANEAYESIITARNSSQINWDDIQNSGATTCQVTGAASCGIFANGLQPMYTALTSATAGSSCANYIGILGTTCDVGQAEQTLQDPGPDGIFQTADDTFIPLTGYQRSITISSVLDSSGGVVSTLRGVNITVQYTNPGTKVAKTYVLSTYISQYQ
jgi:prepilin-type N-terminal cleavage/methylation domain-containing protein